MDDDKFAPFEQEPSACPFVALEDDRDRRSDTPDYRHRCFASLQPEPRAFPHQERYCLSRGFVDCPIFLDWAHREAASIVPGRRSRQPAAASVDAGAGAGAAQVGSAGAAGAAAGAAAAAASSGPSATLANDDADAPNADEVDVPAFLAGRGRAAMHEPESETVPDPDAGLWGPAETRRPVQRQAVGTARPNRGRPDWEPAVREERYPRIHRRSNTAAVQTIVVIIVAVAALALAFFFLPGLLPQASKPNVTPTPSHVATPTPRPTATIAPSPTAFTYVIKPGDSFSGIAAKFGLTVDELKAANPQVTNVDVIKDGDVLTIPAKGAAPAPTTQP